MQGVAGTNGTNGLDGAKGDTGEKGDTGATGLQGVAGTNGTNGLDGAVGPAGRDGSLLADADATTKGKIQLAGDLGGSADAPTVPGLAIQAAALGNKVDKVTGSSLITDASITRLANTSGTNTGDQDLSSLATNTNLDLKANILSPTFTGTPLAPTASLGTNNTQIATTAFVSSAFAGTSPISVLSGAVSLDDLGVTTAKIADNAITTAKIQDLSVTVADIANNAVSIAKLPAGATATTFLRGDGIWALPLTNTASTSILLNGLSFERAAFTGEVTAVQNSNALTIATSAVTGAKIADLTITGAKVADATITNTNLATVPTKTFKGRTDASTGVVQDLTVAQVKTDLAIDLVNNTADLSKPISTVTQTALDLKANLISPTFTGSPILPTGTIAVTQAANNNSTAIATTAYTDAAARAIYSRATIDSSPTPLPQGLSLFNYYTITAQAEPATFNVPSGSVLDGNSLIVKIKAQGSEQALNWNAIYRGGTDIALPTITNKIMVVHFLYNAVDTKWDLVGLTSGL